MLIYNVTIKVDTDIVDEWLPWIHQIHIPEVLATGLFEKYQLSRILETDDSGGFTFSVQYYTASIDNYHEYITNHSAVIRKHLIDKWGEKFTAFRTVMEVVH